MRIRTLTAGLAVTLALAAPSFPAMAHPASTDTRMDVVMSAIADDPIAYREFFTEFPKGADLHQHLSGAVWAESLITWAAQDGLCLTPVTFVASAGPCTSEQISAASVQSSPSLQSEVIAAWSMRMFIPSLTHSGHDQFFNTFGKFSRILDPANRSGQALAEVLNQAAADSVVRLETKFSPVFRDFPTLISAINGQAPSAVRDPARFPEALAVLRSAGLDAQAEYAIAGTTGILAAKDASLGCVSAAPQPGCGVDLGLIAQVNRNATPDSVFAELALDFSIASRDSRVVAVDLVAPEDGLNALNDYSLHMTMVRFMRSQFPGVHVTLHAGELVPGLVPPAALTSHIRQAVEVAGAERIGHGVSIRNERNAKQLMSEMRKRGVLVEVSLTSNEQILGIKGKQSQLPVYRANGVPVSLSTDDPGVERTDLSAQYMKARRWFQLSYADLKKMSYDGIAHAFVSNSSKIALKSRLDRAFANFEKKYAR